MQFNEMEMRRGILRLSATGQSVTVPGDFEIVAAKAKSFGKAKGVPVHVTPGEAGAIVTRIERVGRGVAAYPQIGTLEPGDSVLIDAPPSQHQRVRVTVSQFGARVGRIFSCTKTGDAITVTRIDGAAAHAVAQPVRVSRWGLERLATEPELRITLTPADQNKLRLAATTKAKATGWTIRCRLQDDGTMLVYRTDAEAPRAQGA